MSKIYVIEAKSQYRDENIPAKYDDLYDDLLAKCDLLGKSIATLAREHKEDAWFHDYKDPVGGAPGVLLECSESFLDAVRKLPHFGRVYEQDRFRTERSPSIQRHFFATRPASPKKRQAPGTLLSPQGTN